jgi:hypothetical protein
MTAHPHDDIEAYALGALDTHEAKEVLAHADECPTCAVLLAETIRVASALEPSGERDLVQPIDVSGLTQTSVRMLRPRSTRLPWILASAATAAALALLVWNADLRSRIVVVPIASLVHSHFEHHALRGANGNAKVIQALDGHWLYLVADGLAPRTSYRLGERTGGEQRFVGEVTTDTTGRAAAYWEQAPTRIQALTLDRASAVTPSAQELRWP